MGTHQTSNYNLPYPDGNELVKDGDNAIEALARAVDAAIKALSNSTNSALNSLNSRVDSHDSAISNLTTKVNAHDTAITNISNNSLTAGDVNNIVNNAIADLPTDDDVKNAVDAGLDDYLNRPWTTLNLATGIDPHADYYVPACRVGKHGWVQMRGAVTKSPGQFMTFDPLFTVPVGARPPHEVATAVTLVRTGGAPALAANATAAKMVIGTDGGATIHFPHSEEVYTVIIDGSVYSTGAGPGG